MERERERGGGSTYSEVSFGGGSVGSDHGGYLGNSYWTSLSRRSKGVGHQRGEEIVKVLSFLRTSAKKKNTIHMTCVDTVTERERG